jgi:hypothetical protein
LRHEKPSRHYAISTSHPTPSTESPPLLTPSKLTFSSPYTSGINI